MLLKNLTEMFAKSGNSYLTINKRSLTTKKFKLSGNAYTIRKWMQINMRDGQYLFLFMMSLNIPDLHLNKHKYYWIQTKILKLMTLLNWLFKKTQRIRLRGKKVIMGSNAQLFPLTDNTDGAAVDQFQQQHLLD
jgi:hypothetical protein